MAMDALDRITTLETKQTYMERDIKELEKVRDHVRWIERYIWMFLGGIMVLQTVAMFYLAVRK